MSGKADFTAEEWQVVLEGPPSAGMIVVTAQRGGTLRETIAIAKSYLEARKQHGESQLLDEIVSAKPEMDHTRLSLCRGAQGPRSAASSRCGRAARAQGDIGGAR